MGIVRGIGNKKLRDSLRRVVAKAYATPKPKKRKPYDPEATKAKQRLFRQTCDAWCQANGLPEPVFEYRFHDERKWRFDVAFPQEKVAVEIHGGLFRFGHHSRGKGFLDDREKMAEAQRLGWKVLEVAPSGKHPNTLYSPQMRLWLRSVL